MFQQIKTSNIEDKNVWINLTDEDIVIVKALNQEDSTQCSKISNLPTKPIHCSV